MFDADHILIALATAATIVVAVLIHYEAINILRGVRFRFLEHPRFRLVFVILGIIVAHVIEIWAFAITYVVLEQTNMESVIVNLSEPTFADYVYYSMVVYTSLGFGDLYPEGPIRFLTGSETLAGLVLISWTAAFTFYEMQQAWGDD